MKSYVNYLLISVSIFLFGACFQNEQNKNASDNKSIQNLLAPGTEIQKNHFILDSSNCAQQEKAFVIQKNTKLLYFDSKGMFDENTYKNSPSARLKTSLLSDKGFKELAANNFDVAVISQDCRIGEQLAEKFEISIFPSILFLDQDNRQLFTIPGTNVSALMKQLEVHLNN